MEDLIDIQGLDHIGFWPLSWGWWILIAILACSIALFTWYLIRRQQYRKSWKYQAFSRLSNIQLQVNDTDPKILLQSLSLELRKIAMLATKRESCASLTGKEWLKWLQDNDPRKFAWESHGELLIAAQYMPELKNQHKNEISTMIKAAKDWVRR
jgi:hypothetical protein